MPEEEDEEEEEGEDDEVVDIPSRCNPSVSNGKITICHKKKKTLSVSINAWPAHQAHGDTKGACK